MRGKKTKQGIIDAFNAAIQGIIYTFKYERNMKIHYCVAALVLIISLFLNIWIYGVSKKYKIILL